MVILQELINEFISIHAHKSNTYKAYQCDLRNLTNYFDDIHDLNTVLNLRNLRLQWQEQYSPKTLKRKWSSLREFCKYCYQINCINKCNILDIKIPSLLITQITEPNHELLELICNSPDDLRDKAMLWCLYSTGMKLSELMQYGLLKNFNFASKQIHINNRIVFLNDYACNLVQEYIAYLESVTKLNLNDFVFQNESNEIPSETYLYTCFANYAKNLNIKAKLSDLRHSLIYRLIHAGAKPEEIIKIMGFKSKKSLNLYYL